MFLSPKSFLVIIYTIIPCDTFRNLQKYVHWNSMWLLSRRLLLTIYLSILGILYLSSGSKFREQVSSSWLLSSELSLVTICLLLPVVISGNFLRDRLQRLLNYHRDVLRLKSVLPLRFLSDTHSLSRGNRDSENFLRAGKTMLLWHRFYSWTRVTRRKKDSSESPENIAEYRELIIYN